MDGSGFSYNETYHVVDLTGEIITSFVPRRLPSWSPDGQKLLYDGLVLDLRSRQIVPVFSMVNQALRANYPGVAEWDVFCYIWGARQNEIFVVDNINKINPGARVYKITLVIKAK